MRVRGIVCGERTERVREMLVGVEEEDVTMAAASSGCSSGCQSGWTTYLDDEEEEGHSSSYSCRTARFHGKAELPCYRGCDDYSEEAEEEDLSMISDASSGPRQHYSAGSDEGAAAARVNARAERRGRRTEPAAARRQGKVAAIASLLEDTASSPASFKYSTVMSSQEANGCGSSAAPTMETGNCNAADFSCAFSAMTGFKPPLTGYLQVQYYPAPVKPMPTRQVCRDGGHQIKRYW